MRRVVIVLGFLALTAPLAACGGKKEKVAVGTEAPARVTTIGVNAYLWRATLDTLSFLPLASADPYGGVVITDWYANPSKADERLKATVYILDTRLRADGISAAVFRETLVGGAWVPASVSPDTNIALENAILAKARQLRLGGVE